MFYHDITNKEALRRIYTETMEKAGFEKKITCINISNLIDNKQYFIYTCKN